jgi:hypothetical protein
MFMIIIIGVVAVAALIFCFRKVLKNTYEELFIRLAEKNHLLDKAYDGVYYPCTLWVRTEPGPQQYCIFDFSIYDEHNIIGLQVSDKELREETLVLPNVLVYQPVEGSWLWKFDENGGAAFGIA